MVLVMPWMDLNAPIPVLSAFALAFLLYCFSKKAKGIPRGGRVPVPTANGGLPLIGHIHLLGGPVPLHQVLGKMAAKHGPIFSVNLGVHKAVIVNSREIAKECLTTKDKAIAGRPRSVVFEILAYNHSMFSLSHYGPYWRYIRKVVTTEVLSNHRLGLLEHVRELEVQAAIRGVYLQWKEKKPLVDMKKVFSDIVLNIIFRTVAGKRYEDENDNDRGRAALRYAFEAAGTFLVSDAFPFLRWLDVGGHEKAMRVAARELDHMMQGWLDEHRTRRKVGVKGNGGEEVDFMDVMISIIGSGREEISNYDTDTVIKATCMALVFAASETNMVTLTWTLSLLLNNKEALTKAQQELDAVVGRDRRVRENDLKNLPYIQAIIKETLRRYPAVPLSLPHEAMEDFMINGYHVEKGTRILFNLSMIQRDPKAWEDPDEFRPERFLTTHKDVDVRGQNFELIPFGSGRRICAGISMALQVLGLSLASLLHGFNVATPRNEPVDMTESVGLSNLKATPLRVIVEPRLSERLYDL